MTALAYFAFTGVSTYFGMKYINRYASASMEMGYWFLLLLWMLAGLCFTAKAL